MARTVAEIQQEIIDQKNQDPNLSILNSTSATAIWRLWTYIVAVAINIHEQLWDTFAAEVAATIAANRPGTASWYAERLKEFQLGDTLILINGVPSYEVIDASKQIITRVSFEESAGVVTFKVAKGETGALAPLTVEELAQADLYLQQIKFAGTQTNLVSLNADQLRVSATVYSDGAKADADLLILIGDALDNYLANLPFSGYVYKQDVTDAIQAVEGVVDVDPALVVNVRSGAADNIVSRRFRSPAGYLEEDVAPDDWSTTISILKESIN